MNQQRLIIRNPNYQDPFGNTLLHGAVISGNIQETERLLIAGADPNIANREGRTPLHAAAIFGHRRLYELLVRCGANPALEDRVSTKPIDWLSSMGTFELRF